MRFSEYLYSSILNEADPASPIGGIGSPQLGGATPPTGINPLTTGSPPPLGGLGGMGMGGLGAPQMNTQQGKVKPLVIKDKDVWAILDKALSGDKDKFKNSQARDST